MSSWNLTNSNRKFAGYSNDPRFLKLKLDQYKQVEVRGRLLMAPDLSAPFVKYTLHRNLTANPLVCTYDSYGECPVCDYNSNIWKSHGNDKETAKALSKPYSGNPKWFVNYYVMSDSTQPQNNGKVFLLELTKTMVTAIETMYERVSKEFPNANLFSLDSGFDYIIKGEEDSYPSGNGSTATYISKDKSDFDKNSGGMIVGLTQEIMDAIMGARVPMGEWVDPARCSNTPADLKRALDEYNGARTNGVPNFNTTPMTNSPLDAQSAPMSMTPTMGGMAPMGSAPVNTMQSTMQMQPTMQSTTQPMGTAPLGNAPLNTPLGTAPLGTPPSTLFAGNDVGNASSNSFGATETPTLATLQSSISPVDDVFLAQLASQGQ